MDIKFKEHEKKIRKIHKINLYPKYKEKIKAKVKDPYIIPITIKAFKNLGWDITFYNHQKAEACRKDEFNNNTEKITVNVLPNEEIEVQSISLNDSIWDQGKNSKRVKLFVFAFQEIEKIQKFNTFNTSETKLLVNYWENYTIPETLPAPYSGSFPNVIIFFTGAVFCSLLMAIALSYISIKGIYITVATEIAFAICTTFIFRLLFRLSNFSDYTVIKPILIATIISAVLLSQLFILGNLFFKVTFLSFEDLVNVRLRNNMLFQNDANLYKGFLLSLVFQAGVPLFLSLFRVSNDLKAFKIERVPQEVTDYAYNQFQEGQTEPQVREGLFSKGWRNPQNQNEVIEAVEAFYGFKTT